MTLEIGKLIGKITYKVVFSTFSLNCINKCYILMIRGLCSKVINIFKIIKKQFGEMSRGK